MKILHVIETLGKGGAEHLLLSIAPALRDRGHQCEVAVLWPPYDLAGDLERLGITVHRLDIGHRWGAAAALRALLPLMRSGYDVVHSHLFFAGFYSALSSFFSGEARRVATFHNCDYDSYPADTLPRRAAKSLNGYLMRNRMDALVAISDAVADNYRRHLGLKRFTIVPNSVDFREIDAVSRDDRPGVLAQYGVSGAGTVIVLPGRFAHEKGHLLLVEALALLGGEGRFPLVLMVGNGPLREEVERRARSLGVASQVLLHPAVPRAELLRLMGACNLVAVPSTHEGFGMVALEAMALGIPVVAAAVGGLCELIEDRVSGLLVTPAHPGALAGAIGELMKDPGLGRSLGAGGRQRARESFDLERCILALEQVYLDRSAD